MAGERRRRSLRTSVPRRLRASTRPIDRDHRPCTPDPMASKYAFNAGLKELRFLFCQTSDHSAATRYGVSILAGVCLADNVPDKARPDNARENAD